MMWIGYGWIAYGMMFVLGLLSVLLIFVVLLQRGRGGGLAGALGGMGGQSAFGTKAGDVFTKITVILAMVWIVLAAGSIPLMRYLAGNKFEPGSSTPATITAPPLKGDAAKAFPGDDPSDDALDKADLKNTAPADGEKKSGDDPAESDSSDETKPNTGTPSQDTPPESKDQPTPEESSTDSEDQPKDSPEK